MDDLISRQALYEKTAEWEAQALHMVEVHLHDEDLTEWRKWSAILNERTAFKHDIADAPSAERRGKWIYKSELGWGETWVCSECGEKTTSTVMGKPRWDYCPNCGAEMITDKDDTQ